MTSDQVLSLWRKDVGQTYLFHACAFERADTLRGLSDPLPDNVRLVDAKVDGKDFSPDRSR